ncbi:aspartate ammonia-lyase [Paracoccus pantotrophus]|uniref:Aspartate ammonia-lyase n=1 Tax=Paracoccus pantotrophus TaxID=82367 RepID=A0AAE6TS39_PARPN|nr:aspartate ammonia-lyase [Paracoccus pantotrophus]QFG34827.1 aspartate ammonia-lyase [Paracoccus pantotrophus]RKS43596.1 aspartate ammonia-lyase [Paracoccus pantotrophus]
MISGESWIRIESDELGSRRLPGEALYGINTLRAAENFPVSGMKIGSLAPLIRAMALTKKAAAAANYRLGKLSARKAEVIGRVCDELMAGQHAGHFVIDVFQGGGGTSSHMNLNEVIANRGLELMGRACGQYEHLHPIRDVNRSQSTTDVHATALRIALMQGAPGLERALLALAEAFAGKAQEFGGILKLARTHLQDAAPMTLGEEFHAFSTALRHEAARIWPASQGLAGLNLGGTMVGTGLAAQPDFAETVIAELQRLTELPLRRDDDLVCAAWNSAGLVQFSSLLRGIAVTLSKIANDLRLLSSGPRGGIGEIALPAVQPGSPLIAGKVNPVIPEMVSQVAFHVAGADVAVGMAAEAGQLQRNAFVPLMAHCLLTSLGMIESAARIFAERCVQDIRAVPEACAGNLSAPGTLAAGLVPLVGHEAAADIAEAVARGEDLDALLRARGLAPGDPAD